MKKKTRFFLIRPCLTHLKNSIKFGIFGTSCSYPLSHTSTKALHPSLFHIQNSKVEQETETGSKKNGYLRKFFKSMRE